jgi:5-(carboxyamino)imidazole ribonucleotide synthase
MKKIGIIGGGQLARMMALAAHPLGLETCCLESTQDCPAGLVTKILVGDYHDSEKLCALADCSDVITYEFENISAAALKYIDNSLVYPPVEALHTSQDRLQEKNFFNRLDIPTTQHAAVHSVEGLHAGIAHTGLPALLKKRTLGYDGKGQRVIHTEEDILPAWENLKADLLLLENKVLFDRELSCIAVRAITGEIAFYDLIENQHKEGILHLSQVASVSQALQDMAHTYVTRILEAFQYVGVLTVEFFEKEGQLITNEIAPRVHNSGHWTIEGADTSQFENHLRAICGLPLGSTATRGHVAMYNLIGILPPLAEIHAIPGAHYHAYGKTARAGRKLGHVTLCVENKIAFDRALEMLGRIFE